MGLTIDFTKYYEKTTQGCDTSGFGWLRNCVSIFLDSKTFKDKGHILDLGSGTGYWSKALMDLGYRVTPCDFDNSQLPETIVSDMHKLKFPSEKFDGILCTGTFEHSIAPYIALSEMSRVLKVGGILYIDMPSEINTRVINLPQHVNTQCYSNMINLAEKVNLRLLKCAIIQEKEAGEHQTYVFEKEKLK